jgi:hypothetical protein
MRWPSYFLISTAVMAVGAGCGVDVDVFGNSSGIGGSGATGGGGSTTTNGGNGGNGGTTTTGGGGIGGTGGGGGTCDPFVEEVAMRPLDMILTIDHSGSAGALWPSLQAEIEVFATTPRPPGTQLAFNMSPDGGNACEVANYTPRSRTTAPPWAPSSPRGASPTVAHRWCNPSKAC